MTVVGLGAWCDLAPEGAGAPTGPAVSFTVHEFAVLADGRRVTLHQDRGFTSRAHSAGPVQPTDPWQHLTRAGLERDVRTTVLPDDDDGEEHPWQWLAGLVRAHGIETSPDELRRMPYVVELSPGVLARLPREGG